MPQTSTSGRSTKKKAARPAQEHPPRTESLALWSGRIDADELQRPGGELMAALAQFGAERGLDLHGMARAMGVSYWELSPLRFGFRRIEAIDDELAEACARFLGVTPMLVRTMLERTEADEALKSPELGAVDIAHLWHRLCGRPGACVPPAELDGRRPLRTLSIEELQTLWERHGVLNPAVAAALQAELEARPVSPTERLRAALAASIAQRTASSAQNAPSGAILRCTGCAKRLRVPRLASPGEIRCPSCGAEYAVHWDESVCLVVPQPPEPGPALEGETGETAEDADMTEAQARAVLGLGPEADRVAIERTRRALLQHYHPDRLGQVSPLVRKLAEDAFRRVNAASARLLSAL